MKLSIFKMGLVVLVLMLVLGGAHSWADPNSGMASAATVVLVHGAFADGSSWSKVISKLQSKGVDVVSVQNPLTSLTDDVDAAQRAIDAAEGPVVLVGHSYGGSVITQAGNSEKVKALVYIAAYAPDDGQGTLDLGTDLPPTEGLKTLAPDKLGFFKLPMDSVVKNFAQDIPADQAKILYAAQGPTNGKALSEKVAHAAWKDKKDFYMVTTQDRMIQLELQRRMAKAMNAQTVEVPSSHVPMISHPDEVVKLILAAVDSIK